MRLPEPYLYFKGEKVCLGAKQKFRTRNIILTNFL